MAQEEWQDWGDYLQLNQNQDEIMDTLLLQSQNLFDRQSSTDKEDEDEDEDEDKEIDDEQSDEEDQEEKNQNENEKEIMDFNQEQRRQTRIVVNQQHKKYLRKIDQLSKVEYYKSEYKFNKKIRQIYLTKPDINPRELFEDFKKQFEQINFQLCQIKIQVYCPKNQQDKIKRYEQNNTLIEEEIEKMLKKYCYNEVVEEVVIQETQLEKIIELLNFIRFHQFIHFTLKIPKKRQQQQQIRLGQIKWDYLIQGRQIQLQVQRTKYQHKDYLTVNNCSYCNSLKSWDIGCRANLKGKQNFYTYFKPAGQHWMTFSRSMHQIQRANIRQICIYVCFDEVVLKIVIKKQQIYQLSYSSSKQDVYIFFSSPPVYEICKRPPKTYCRPNYLSRWSRVQNFLFVKHRYFKDNDFLRMFMYSNSYIHLQLNKKDKKSYQNINFDIQLLQIQLRCKSQKLSKQIKIIEKPLQLLNLFDQQFIKQSLSFIRIPKKPFLTSHIKWKLSYQIMLYIRFNVIGPDELKDFLRLLEINQDNIDKILECLTFRSAGFTNKVAGLNRFRKDVYLKLKYKIFDFVTEYNAKNREFNKNQNTCLIYKICLTPSGLVPNPISSETKCRLIRQYETQSQFFLKLVLLDDTGFTIKNQQYLNRNVMRQLLDNIVLLQKKYLPLGWSGSQLKGSSIWFVSQIAKNEGDFREMTQRSILRFLGDFSKITIAAKKAARIGQAFSSSYCFNSQHVKQKIVKDDISEKGFLFTDGIGQISKDLFEKVCHQFGGIDINCCFQIRYKGAKGVLLLNEELADNTILLRESMVKYRCEDPAAQKYLDILSWDKYLPGYLNREIIVLLMSLKVQDNAFLYFQRQYIKKLMSLNFREIDGNLLRIFSDANDLEDSFSLTIKSLSSHFDLSRDLFFQQLLDSIKDNKFMELKKKSRILIQKSARLIGVIDDYDVLKEGQLYCSIKKMKKSQVQVINGYVVITRNPSLSPSDVRRCKCISEQQIKMRMENKGRKNYFSKFINCIVFPKKGLVPLTAQISGSDLDGDTFFICWDHNFIIKQPQAYQTIDDPNKKSPVSIGQVGYKQMLDFFVRYNDNAKLGMISNIHLIHADNNKQKSYARHQKCRRIAKIHGVVVDYAKSGVSPGKVPQDLMIRKYPDFMEKWDKPYYQSNSILGKLYRECKQTFQEHKRVRNRKSLYLYSQLFSYFSVEQIKTSLIADILDRLKAFEFDISDLLYRANVYSQFQLYSGSSSENDELKNDFGRSRLANWLQEVRQKHLKSFFGSHLEQFYRYRRLKQNKLKETEKFSRQIYIKAIMTYFISYVCYCNKENIQMGNIPNKLANLSRQVLEMKKNRYYNGTYIGFVWIIIPKVIINFKLTEKNRKQNK